ncbi:unnamed protein product [Cylicocyclus nassatus]|uniref:Uncharacterized protein n=1 Tax=Cylicocyclus nassatus TaxID=53992 RepID=A0AA36H257_CYLNA|nr:unnamed protein product [Cylicocyclus nassatus]
MSAENFDEMRRLFPLTVTSSHEVSKLARERPPCARSRRGERVATSPRPGALRSAFIDGVFFVHRAVLSLR